MESTEQQEDGKPTPMERLQKKVQMRKLVEQLDDSDMLDSEIMLDVLGISERKLRAMREEQRKLISEELDRRRKAGLPLKEPAIEIPIEHGPPCGSGRGDRAEYNVGELRKHLKARGAVTMLDGVPITAASVRTFASLTDFLATGTHTDSFPFAIDGNGRPVDIPLAVGSGMPYRSIAWLTLPEFLDRMSSSVSTEAELLAALVEHRELENHIGGHPPQPPVPHTHP